MVACSRWVNSISITHVSEVQLTIVCVRTVVRACMYGWFAHSRVTYALRCTITLVYIAVSCCTVQYMSVVVQYRTLVRYVQQSDYYLLSGTAE